MDIYKLKIKKQLLEKEKISYASDHIELPEGGIDCSEGCNPYGFPPECADVLKNFEPAKMGPYPHSQALYDAIREYWKDQIDVERDNLILTDGSISALYIVNNIFDTHDAVVLGISPQFTDYYMHAGMLGIEYAPYQLDRLNNYKFDIEQFLQMNYEEYVGSERAHGRSYNYIYIDNPNNPTGQMIDINDIERIVSEAVKFDITVIIDEAYGDFMDKNNSAVRLFAKYPNMVVVRTLSKGYGLAGLRIGYIIAHKELIHCMNKMINPYMVGELDREIGAAALSNRGFVERCKADFAEMKKQLREALGCSEDCPQGSSGRLHMAETLDTNSLFMLYHDDQEINLKAEFRKRGVLVIDGYDFKGLDSSAARVRLPEADDFPVLLEAVREINAL
ncbi:MAG: histidinol-phosphate aminotransferase family protein [Mogibacterium sp.]|nr:histidinol-phosphate aminotransferase family protein [Mogibacterium sp.]